jgi:hypothetical protein
MSLYLDETTVPADVVAAARGTMFSLTAPIIYHAMFFRGGYGVDVFRFDTDLVTANLVKGHAVIYQQNVSLYAYFYASSGMRYFHGGVRNFVALSGFTSDPPYFVFEAKNYTESTVQPYVALDQAVFTTTVQCLPFYFSDSNECGATLHQPRRSLSHAALMEMNCSFDDNITLTARRTWLPSNWYLASVCQRGLCTMPSSDTSYGTLALSRDPNAAAPNLVNRTLGVLVDGAGEQTMWSRSGYSGRGAGRYDVWYTNVNTAAFLEGMCTIGDRPMIIYMRFTTVTSTFLPSTGRNGFFTDRYNGGVSSVFSVKWDSTPLSWSETAGQFPTNVSVYATDLTAQVGTGVYWISGSNVNTAAVHSSLLKHNSRPLIVWWSAVIPLYFLGSRQHAIMSSAMAPTTGFVVDYQPTAYQTYVILPLVIQADYFNGGVTGATIYQAQSSSVSVAAFHSGLVELGSPPKQMWVYMLPGWARYFTASRGDVISGSSFNRDYVGFIVWDKPRLPPCVYGPDWQVATIVTPEVASLTMVLEGGREFYSFPSDLSNVAIHAGMYNRSKRAKVVVTVAANTSEPLPGILANRLQSTDTVRVNTFYMNTSRCGSNSGSPSFTPSATPTHPPTRTQTADATATVTGTIIATPTKTQLATPTMTATGSRPRSQSASHSESLWFPTPTWSPWKTFSSANMTMTLSSTQSHPRTRTRRINPSPTKTTHTVTPPTPTFVTATRTVRTTPRPPTGTATATVFADPELRAHAAGPIVGFSVRECLETTVTVNIIGYDVVSSATTLNCSYLGAPCEATDRTKRTCTCRRPHSHVLAFERDEWTVDVQATAPAWVVAGSRVPIEALIADCSGMRPSEPVRDEAVVEFAGGNGTMPSSQRRGSTIPAFALGSCDGALNVLPIVAIVSGALLLLRGARFVYVLRHERLTDGKPVATPMQPLGPLRGLAPLHAWVGAAWAVDAHRALQQTLIAAANVACLACISALALSASALLPYAHVTRATAAGVAAALVAAAVLRPLLHLAFSRFRILDRRRFYVARARLRDFGGFDVGVSRRTQESLGGGVIASTAAATATNGSDSTRGLDDHAPLHATTTSESHEADAAGDEEFVAAARAATPAARLPAGFAQLASPVSVGSPSEGSHGGSESSPFARRNPLDLESAPDAGAAAGLYDSVVKSPLTEPKSPAPLQGDARHHRELGFSGFGRSAAAAAGSAQSQQRRRPSCASHCRIVSRRELHAAVGAAVIAIAVCYALSAYASESWCGDVRATWNAAMLIAVAADALLFQPLFVLGVAVFRYTTAPRADPAVAAAAAAGRWLTPLMVLRAAPHPPYPAHGAWIVDERLLPADVPEAGAASAGPGVLPVASVSSAPGSPVIGPAPGRPHAGLSQTAAGLVASPAAMRSMALASAASMFDLKATSQAELS